MELNEINLEKLMATDVKMRDQIAKLEQEIKDIKAKRETVQQALLEACRELNVTSLKTSVGTLTRTLKTRYWTDNWPKMYEFLIEHGVLELMEKRLAQGAVKEFLENNPDVLPPGLQSTQEYQVVIRKNRENKE